MSGTLQVRQGAGAPPVALPTAAEPRAPWIVAPTPSEERPLPGARCVRQLSRDMECLRAACVGAGPLRRWWLRKRLRAVLREKEALEQHWRRRR